MAGLFFHILFWCLTWGLNLDLTSNKSTHYLLVCKINIFSKRTYIFGCAYTSMIHRPNQICSLSLTFFHTSFWCLTRDLNSGLYYLLDYGNFRIGILGWQKPQSIKPRVLTYFRFIDRNPRVFGTHFSFLGAVKKNQ